MIWEPVAGLIIGALLAQRFRFVVLLPATLVTGVVLFTACGIGIVSVVVIGIAMQVGYFVGLLLWREPHVEQSLSFVLRRACAAIPGLNRKRANQRSHS